MTGIVIIDRISYKYGGAIWLIGTATDILIDTTMTFIITYRVATKHRPQIIAEEDGVSERLCCLSGWLYFIWYWKLSRGVLIKLATWLAYLYRQLLCIRNRVLGSRQNILKIDNYWHISTYSGWYNKSNATKNKGLSKLLSVKEKIARYFEEISNFAQRIEIGFSTSRFPKTDGLIAHTQDIT